MELEKAKQIVKNIIYNNGKRVNYIDISSDRYYEDSCEGFIDALEVILKVLEENNK